MKFELEDTIRGVSDEEILQDLRRCAELLGKNTISSTEYQHAGRASSGTVLRRFGTWNKALEKAGLSLKYHRNISNDELFENIEQMWVKLGRQPRYSEVKFPFSKYSTFSYDSRFGTYSEALKQFVAWVNSDEEAPLQDQIGTEFAVLETSKQATTAKRRTRRDISDRQRFRILVRDGFRCKACGASPLKESGVELHVDHILPWSKGGETVDENLECKCKQCNLGKSNAFDV